MRVVLFARRLLTIAALLHVAPAFAVGASDRPQPDGSAIEEVLRGSGQPEIRYVSARAVEHYLRARLALEDGILERAEEELSLASVYDPQSAWPRYAMAVEHLRHDESQEAEKDLRIALQVDPRHSPSLKLRARLLLDQGRAAQAIDTLESAVQAEPRDPEPLALLVRAHLAQGQILRARTSVESLDALANRREDEVVPAGQALALSAEAHLTLAEALDREGRFVEAEHFYRRSLDRQPGNVTLMDALVRFLETRGRFDDAARLAASSLGFAGPRPSRLLRVARLLLAADQPKAAAAYVSLAAESHDEAHDVEALISTGASLLGANEVQVALEAFQAALARAPERNDARWYAALAAETLGRFGEAIEGYQMLAPGTRLFTLGAARAAYCEHRLGRNEVALRTLVALTEEAPDDEDVLVLLARVREALGDAATVIAQVEERLTRRPTRRLMLELAGLYRRHQRSPEAVAMLELERRAVPKDEEVAWSLAQALAAAGRTERALAEAKSLLGRQPARGEVANFVAWLLAERGTSPEDAENYAWLALELEPERWEYQDTLGWAQLKARKFAQAVETLEMAYAQAPGEIDVALHLAEALAAAGQPRRSIALLKDITLRTRNPAQAAKHERAARLLESLAASVAPTADAKNATAAP